MPRYCILVTTDFKQGLFSLCSMAGLQALEVNPFTNFQWSVKHAYLVLNGTKWDLRPVSTIFIPLPERARVSLEILQIQKMLKKNPNKPKQTGKLTLFRLLGLLGLTFMCLRLPFQLTHYYCSICIISSQPFQPPQRHLFYTCSPPSYW